MSEGEQKSPPCLSLPRMREYQKGALSKTEEREVERHLVDCPLCSSVFQSFQSEDDFSDIKKTIQQLSAPIQEQCGISSRTPLSKGIKWGVGGAIGILLLGSVLYLLTPASPTDQKVSTSPETPVSDTSLTSTTSSTKDTSQLTDTMPPTSLTQLFGHPPYDTPVSQHIKPRILWSQPSPPQSGITPPRFEEVLAASQDTLRDTTPTATTRPVSETSDTIPQQDTTYKKPPPPHQTLSDTTTQVADTAKIVQAKYPGGAQGFRKYLQYNMHYPDSLAKKGVRATISATVTITSSGGVQNIRIQKGKHEVLNNEAIRLLQNMPEWEPAQRGETPISTDTTLTISFTPSDTTNPGQD